MSIQDDIQTEINNLPSSLPVPATRSNPVDWENQKEQWGEFLNDITFTILEELLGVFKESSTYLMSSSFKKSDNLGTEDLNTLYDTSNNGFRLQPTTSNATLVRNYPINQAGTLLIFSTQPEYSIQIYIPYQGTTFYIRTNKVADATSWNTWVSTLFSKDIINDLVSGGVSKILSAEQGKILNNTKLGITGGSITGSLTIDENLTVSDAFNCLKGVKINGTDTLFVDNSNYLVIGNGSISGIKLRNTDSITPSWSDMSSGSEVVKPLALQEDLDSSNNEIDILENKVNTPLKADNSSISSINIIPNTLYTCSLSNTAIFTWTINTNYSDPVLGLSSLIDTDLIKQKLINKQVNKYIIKLNLKFTTAFSQIETLDVRFINTTLGTISKTIVVPTLANDVTTEVEFTTITTSNEGYSLGFFSSMSISELKILSITRI